MEFYIPDLGWVNAIHQHGDFKPALWHTPAITNDGIILQAPDPREKRAGFTPSPHQAVEMRTSPAPTHLDLQG